MKTNNLLIAVLFIPLFFISCEQNEAVQTTQKDYFDISSLTQEEIDLRNNLQQISTIVADISNEGVIYKEIYSGINESVKLGFDEQYRFKDILYPANISLKSTKKTLFATKFSEAIAKDNNFKSVNAIESFLIDENVQIYWPYSDRWDGETQPYITFAPINQDDVNYGYRKVLYPNGDELIDSALIDDDFAYSNPVWIINLCGNSNEEIEYVKSKQTLQKSAIVTHQLSVGYVMSSKHYDGLFSGGDEYKFCIIGGDITSIADTIAISFDNIQSVNLTRTQIKDNKWKYCYYELDDDWYVESDGNEGSRRFGLIEYDPKKVSRKLTFEPKVTIKTVAVSLGSYVVTITSNDEWIKTDTYQRNNFLKMNTTDTGNGLKDGYQVYAAGDVYWTMPIREF